MSSFKPFRPYTSDGKCAPELIYIEEDDVLTFDTNHQMRFNGTEG